MTTTIPTHKHHFRFPSTTVLGVVAVAICMALGFAAFQLVDSQSDRVEPVSSTPSAEVRSPATAGPNADIAPLTTTSYGATNPSPAITGPNAGLAPMTGDYGMDARTPATAGPNADIAPVWTD